jgi:hypothetical protein
MPKAVKAAWERLIEHLMEPEGRARRDKALRAVRESAPEVRAS